MSTLLAFVLGCSIMFSYREDGFNGAAAHVLSGALFDMQPALGVENVDLPLFFDSKRALVARAFIAVLCCGVVLGEGPTVTLPLTLTLTLTLTLHPSGLAHITGIPSSLPCVSLTLVCCASVFRPGSWLISSASVTFKRSSKFCCLASQS